MMNQDRRLLEVQYPLITSYVEHAALFSIVGDSEDMKSWICNNYVQLCMISNDYGYNPFFFPHNNLLRCPILETKIIEYNHRNFHEIVKEYINDGYYIHTSLDEFFIQPWVYKVHYKHPAFIYGYDDKAKSIYLADFVYPKQQFNFFEVDYYNVDQAYLCDQGVQDFMSKQSLQIIGFKLKEDGNYKFCVPKLIKLLEDYRMSDNLSNIYDDSLEKGSTKDFVFGLDIYDSIAEYMDYYKKNDDKIWLHLFGIPLDHKKIMRYRINYLLKAKIIREDPILGNVMEELYILNERALYLSMKYNMTKRKEILERLLGLIFEMKQKEEKLIDKLIMLLKESSCNLDISD